MFRQDHSTRQIKDGTRERFAILDVAVPFASPASRLAERDLPIILASPKYKDLEPLHEQDEAIYQSILP